MRLHNYQERMAEFIQDTPYCALWAEMGLGKTAATLTAIEYLFNTLEIAHILILGPPKVIEKVWPDEIAKWNIRVPFYVVAGNPKKRLATLIQAQHITLCSVNNLQWLIDAGVMDQYDMIILDEAHYFKSQKAKRFQALRKATKETARIVELTGTPAGNGLLDLWTQVFLLDRGERLGKSYTYYRTRYFEADYMGYNFELYEGAKEEIYEQVADICTSLSAAEYLSLPEVITVQIPVEMDWQARTQYKRLQADFLLSLAEVDIVAASAAALSQKLQQAASGALYDGDGLVHDLHSWKGDALLRVVSDLVGESVLITYSHKFQISQIQALFPGAPLVSVDNIDDWNAGKIPVMICHWSNLGLNLQEGGHILICFGLTWSLTDYQQTVARLWRQGQTKPVIVYQLVCTDTVDEIIIASLADKHATQHELLEKVKMQCQN